MIISKTPYRVSFFGGGTDFPQWFMEYDGAVLSASIDKYCYISLRGLPPFFYHKHRIVYTETELASETSEIKHPVVRECLKFLNIKDGLEIHHDGDLPSRSGLGSSSSFTVGLLHALKAYQGQMVSHALLSELAILIEREKLQEAGGIQDQIAVSHGGFNLVKFSSDGHSIHPVIMGPCAKKELEQSLCLFYTGKSRLAEQIEKKKIECVKENDKTLHMLSELAAEGLTVLRKSIFDAGAFGRLLHDGWWLKKVLAREVTNPQLDEIYDHAINCGAYGGKLLGAGGGGFFLFCVDSYQREAFIEKMKPLLHVPFKFEYEGSTIALYQP